MIALEIFSAGITFYTEKNKTKHHIYLLTLKVKDPIDTINSPYPKTHMRDNSTLATA